MIGDKCYECLALPLSEDMYIDSPLHRVLLLSASERCMHLGGLIGEGRTVSDNWRACIALRNAGRVLERKKTITVRI